MGSQARDDDSESVIAFTPLRGARLLMVSIKSIKQGKQFLDCFTRPPESQKQTVNMPSIRPRSFPISFERPRIGSPSSRPRWVCTEKKPTAPSSGYTECIPRLRTDFYGRPAAFVDRLNAGRARPSIAGHADTVPPVLLNAPPSRNPHRSNEACRWYACTSPLECRNAASRSQARTGCPNT